MSTEELVLLESNPRLRLNGATLSELRCRVATLSSDLPAAYDSEKQTLTCKAPQMVGVGHPATPAGSLATITSFYTPCRPPASAAASWTHMAACSAPKTRLKTMSPSPLLERS